jgi:large subunit ribosomal protein L23
MDINQILVKPVLTEKATSQSAKQTYSFYVNLKANKHQIKKAVQDIYGVTVGEVKVQIRKGKTRRVGRRMTVKNLSDQKIAYIKVTKGTIDIFPKA